MVRPADGNVKAVEIVLVKNGDDDWAVEKPVSAKANASNVKSLLENLGRLKAKESIAKGTEAYLEWGVDDDHAIHAVFNAGDQTKLDVYFG